MSSLEEIAMMVKEKKKKAVITVVYLGVRCPRNIQRWHPKYSTSDW